MAEGEDHLLRMAALLRSAQESEKQLNKTKTELALWKAAAKVAEHEKSGTSSVVELADSLPDSHPASLLTDVTSGTSKSLSKYSNVSSSANQTMTEPIGTTASDAESWRQLHSSLGDLTFQDPKVESVPKLNLTLVNGITSPPVKACTTDDILDGEVYSSDDDHKSSSEERGYTQWTTEHYNEHTKGLEEIQRTVSNLFCGVEFSRLTGKIANPHRDQEVKVVKHTECEQEMQALRRVRRDISSLCQKVDCHKNTNRRKNSDEDDNEILKSQLESLSMDMKSSLHSIQQELQTDHNLHQAISPAAIPPQIYRYAEQFQAETGRMIRARSSPPGRGRSPARTDVTPINQCQPSCDASSTLDEWANRAMHSLLSSPHASSVAPETPNLRYARNYTAQSYSNLGSYLRDPSPISITKSTPPPFMPIYKKAEARRSYPRLVGHEQLRAEQYRNKVAPVQPQPQPVQRHFATSPAQQPMLVTRSMPTILPVNMNRKTICLHFLRLGLK